MPEKPILFSEPMVRAIREGRKTVTRRLMNWPSWYDPGRHQLHIRGDGIEVHADDGNWVDILPRYRRRDRLWVKEPWRVLMVYDGLPPRDIPQTSHIEYPADGIPPSWGRKRSARFMCKWMSRLWLRVTEEPYPERVRDITEAEAIREIGRDLPNDDPVWCFKQVWAGLHGPDSWERDWVWRIAFERTEARQ